MRRIFLKRAYRDAVSWFGSENYRKAFKCAPRVGVFQADCRTFTNPFLMRMGTLDEVREALRLKIGGQPSVWDNCLGLAGVDVSSLEDYVRKCLDSYTSAWSTIVNSSTTMLQITRKRETVDCVLNF